MCVRGKKGNDLFKIIVQFQWNIFLEVLGEYASATRMYSVINLLCENFFVLWVSPAVIRCEVAILDMDGAALGYTPSGLGGTLVEFTAVNLTCAGNAYHSRDPFGRTSEFVCRYSARLLTEVWAYNGQFLLTASTLQ